MSEEYDRHREDSDALETSCPNCYEPDLMGPIGEMFMCYKCGWSFEYGKLTTGEWYDLFKKLRPIILDYHTSGETTNE